MTVRSLVGTAHGIAAVARRRSSYVGQWLGSSAWPKVAYRFGWGPSAPPLLQGVFAAAGEFAATRTDRGSCSGSDWRPPMASRSRSATSRRPKSNG